MNPLRLIARLDVKGPNLVKGVQMEGLRKMGPPNEFAWRYYQEGVDELVYLDIVASLYGRNNLFDVVRAAAQDIFVPLTVGGGLRTVSDVEQALAAGADKVLINTGAITNPSLLTEVAKRFGSQCMVLSIEAKSRRDGSWEAYYDNGREHSDLDVIEWARRGCDLGAGEIMVTSVDREGTAKGFDVALVRQMVDAVPIPVIASGGMGRVEDLVTLASETDCRAVAMAHVLHYGHLSVGDVRETAATAGFDVRRFDAEIRPAPRLEVVDGGEAR